MNVIDLDPAGDEYSKDIYQYQRYELLFQFQCPSNELIYHTLHLGNETRQQ